ncbi:DUF3558 domain-containing protein [Gordonia sp. OPL2]|uniref:DUF3558 domain-containing protein n=1 Tax=Gordonia sp. OPL2 TaxID=2486274 RepID=UPI00165560B1|nr:DUF3558 domain-containing protein [Gordonia sp. OPL2]
MLVRQLSGRTLRASNYVAAALLAAMTLVACDVDGSPSSETIQASDSASPTSHQASVRQTDAAGRRLPFATKFPNRWSSNNDGTTFEPCTAEASDTRTRLQVDENSVADAAVADHQTVRGCEWKLIQPKLAYLSQFVGNFNGSLNQYKQRYAATGDQFLADTYEAGRAVAISPGNSECTTIVRSGTAMVFTSMSFVIEKPTREQMCEKALDYTRATINQIPE